VVLNLWSQPLVNDAVAIVCPLPSPVLAVGLVPSLGRPRAVLADDHALLVGQVRTPASLVQRLGRKDADAVHADGVAPGHVREAAKRLVGLQEDDAFGAAVGADLISAAHQSPSPVKSANILRTAVCVFVARGNSGYHGASTQNASGALLGQLR